MLRELAEAALAALARKGAKTDDGSKSSATWSLVTTLSGGKTCEIRCVGPDLPASIPDTTVFPSDIPKDPKWRETYRLVVSPPVVALDLAWRTEDPMRILTFSRGDWEAALIAMAAT